MYWRSIKITPNTQTNTNSSRVQVEHARWSQRTNITTAVFGFTLFSFLLSRAVPLHVTWLAVSAHVVLVVRYVASQAKSMLHHQQKSGKYVKTPKPKPQKPNPSNTQANVIWEWSDNNKWFPYLRGDSDMIERQYQMLRNGPSTKNNLLGLWKTEINSKTFALSIASVGNYNVTITRSGTGMCVFSYSSIRTGP